MIKYLLIIFAIQFVMSGPSGGADQPPALGGAEGESFDAKDACEQNKNQLETLKEIMLRNKQSLKKKEEEVQVKISCLRFCVIAYEKFIHHCDPIAGICQETIQD